MISDKSGDRNIIAFFGGDLQNEVLEMDRVDALLRHDRCMWKVPL